MQVVGIALQGWLSCTHSPPDPMHCCAVRAEVGVPGVRSAMHAAIGSSMPGAQESMQLQAPPWRPSGVLIAHLAEHRR